jgi:hypothetical protein
MYICQALETFNDGKELLEIDELFYREKIREYDTRYKVFGVVDMANSHVNLHTIIAKDGENDSGIESRSKACKPCGATVIQLSTFEEAIIVDLNAFEEEGRGHRILFDGLYSLVAFPGSSLENKSKPIRICYLKYYNEKRKTWTLEEFLTWIVNRFGKIGPSYRSERVKETLKNLNITTSKYFL